MDDPAEDGSESQREPNYSAEEFMVCREPIQDLIQSFSSLYLEPEQDDEANEVEDSTQLPPPLPLEEED